MKKLILFFCLVLVINITACNKTAKEVDDIKTLNSSDIIIKINGEDVKKSQFDQAFDKLYLTSPFGQLQVDLSLEKNRNLRLMFTEKAVNDIIIRHFIDKEAKKKNILISKEEIQNIYQDIVQKVGGQEKLETQLMTANLDIPSFKENLKNDLLAKKTIEAITGKVVVSDEDAKKYYEENKNIKFNIPESAKISHILITPKTEEIKKLDKFKEDNPLINEDPSKTIDPKIKSEIESLHIKYNKLTENVIKQSKQYAERVLKEVLNNPTKFKDYAMKYSEDRLSAVNGGNLGYFPRGKLNKELNDIIFDKNKVVIGKVYEDLIQTNAGFHIVLVTDRRQEGIIPYDSIKNDIKQILIDTKRIEKLEQFINEKKEKSNIVYEYKNFDLTYLKDQLKDSPDRPSNKAIEGIQKEDDSSSN